MKVDDVKLIFTYLIATAIIVGGGLMLFVSRNEGNSDFALLLAGFIGSAIGFVFNRETQTQTARATERAMLATPAVADTTTG